VIKGLMGVQGRKVIKEIRYKALKGIRVMPAPNLARKETRAVKGPKAIRGTLFRDHRGKTEPMVHRGMMALMARKGTKVVKAPKVIKERPSRDHRAIKVHLFKDRRATMAKMVPRVIRANPQPFLAHKEIRVRQVPSPAHRVIRGAMARKVIKAALGHRERTVGKVLKGTMAAPVRRERKGIRGTPAAQGHREIKEIPEARGLKGHRETLAAAAGTSSKTTT
jgi:hypothetical protein